jgi:DnaK suppressor protein
MHHDEIAQLLDAAATAYQREAAELAEFADLGENSEPHSDASGESDAFGQHPADAASDTVEREIDLGLRLEAGDVLGDIAAAQRRLAEGAYGRCETCGLPIDDDRLRALPWARRCIVDERAFQRSSLQVLPGATA